MTTLTIGETIQHIRQHRAHLTVLKLSKLSGVNRNTISQIEKDQGNPSMASLVKICDAMGYDLVFDLQKRGAQ